MRIRLTTLVLSSLIALAAACGAPPPEPTTPAPPSSATPSTPTPPATTAASTAATPPGTAAPAAVPTTWTEGMPKDQQIAFMKARVLPAAMKTFKAPEAHLTGDASCATCHGPQYKAPKDFLPRLTFKDGKITSFADKPEVSKFMAEHVVPDMAAAMGEPPYDPATHKGFGCGGCHGIDMK